MTEDIWRKDFVKYDEYNINRVLKNAINYLKAKIIGLYKYAIIKAVKFSGFSVYYQINFSTKELEGRK